jgi:hypothetical protein
MSTSLSMGVFPNKHRHQLLKYGTRETPLALKTIELCKQLFQWMFT